MYYCGHLKMLFEQQHPCMHTLVTFPQAVSETVYLGTVWSPATVIVCIL